MPNQDPPAWVLDQRRAIGARIRDRRLWADLTQERLAERVGVDRRTIQRIEAGTSDPTLTVLLLIAHTLRTSIADLLVTDNRP